jgi:hypothetical protein
LPIILLVIAGFITLIILFCFKPQLKAPNNTTKLETETPSNVKVKTQVITGTKKKLE